MPAVPVQPTDPGRGHISPLGPRPRLLVAVLALALVLTVGAIFVVNRSGSDVSADACLQRTMVRVMVTPDLAPTIAAIARQTAAGTTMCDQFVVSGAEPAAVLAVLGTTRAPDVWIPDSTLWLVRARQDGVLSVADAPSVASSPLVLAAPAQLAQQLNPNGFPTAADLLAHAVSGSPPVVQLATTRLAPERVGALLALQEATAGAPEGRAAFGALMRAAIVDGGHAAEEATATTTGQPTAVPTPEPPPALVATSEQTVWRANSPRSAAAATETSVVPAATTGATATATSTATPAGPRLRALYAGSAAYDFPYAVVTGNGRVREIAGRLLDAVLRPSAQSLVRAAGFRDAAGRGGLELGRDRGVDGTVTTAVRPLDEDALAQAEAALSAVRLDARLVAVIDVSGSMAWPIAGRTGSGPSRLQVALSAAGTGMGLYPDTTEVSLWAFSDRAAQGGAAPYREVVGRTTLDAAGRQKLLAGLTSLRPHGDTALYSTTLAAVRAARAAYSPGRVNAVVVLSDGADTEGKLTLDALVSTLAQESSPERPVPVITIAFGPDAPVDALARMSKATGGASYRAASADEIRQVFLDAMGQRACRPACG